MRLLRAGALVLVCAVPAVASEEDAACLECHAKREVLSKTVRDPQRVARLIVEPERYARSVHAARGCTECHFDYDTQPHSEEAETVGCSECHEEAAKTLAASVHGSPPGGKRGASCRDCHGVHDILKPSDRDARLYPLNVYKVCGKCHFSVDPETATPDELLRDPYTDDAHAQGVLKAGLKVSATCVSCHGGHGIRSKGDPESRLARTRVHEVCGQCHVGALEQYERGIHYLKLQGGEPRGAACTDCHFPHAISEANDDFRRQSAYSCSNCHRERGGSFRLTYHGKINFLGYGEGVATCASCHGNHDIRPRSDPASKIHPQNIVATCGQCHEGSHAEFASYLVHADPADGEKYPRIHLVYQFMNWLLIVVLVLGGLHALLWLVRALAAKEWRRPSIGPATRWVRRWPRIYVFYHLTMMTSVLLLASTGLPLHYADKRWAHDLMVFFGGPEAAGWVHRVAAIALGGLFVVFGIHLLDRIFLKREKGLWSGPNTMLPRWKDFQDLWGNIRWFLFLAPRPRYDRWTYWEKFDFWAATWGLFVIGLSGLILWFPEEATHFVPGWFINAAIIIHGIEALLDIAFIFTVHVFHANLRPDKFPMDTMFLTGRIPEFEFHHDRPLEYERYLRAGRLDEVLSARPPRRYTRVWAYIIGSCALAVGFFFVAMMIVAVVQNSG